MVKDIILQHKHEKKRLLGKEYIPREKAKQLPKLLKNDLITVIIGPRRAGKSMFALNSLKQADFAYLNFDDEKLIKIKNYDQIIEAVHEIYGQVKFILFDEIQNLSSWELFINKLQRRGYKLIITGSNARLLSQELGTALTGRYLSVELLPFSFKEYLLAKKINFEKEDLRVPENKGNMLNLLAKYLESGGFPEVVVKGLDIRIYLETLFEAVLLTDVVKRHKVRFSGQIYDLALYLISNFAKEYSFNKLKNTLHFKSTKTVQNYVKYLESAYLIASLNRFSFKIKEQINAPKKVYVIDNGLINSRSFELHLSSSKLIENLVFLEFIRKGLKPNRQIFYYKTRNQKEIDFVIKKDLKIKELVQVCYNLNEETSKREISALIEAGQELDCGNLKIITWDKEQKIKISKGQAIEVLPLWKWLTCWK